MTQSLYDVLSVPRGIDAEALKKVYRRLAKELHPDQHPGDKPAELRFKAINRAYQVLSDPKKRAAYDEFGDESLRNGFDIVRARARSKARENAVPRDARGEPIRTEQVQVRGVAEPSEKRGPSNGFEMLGSLLGRTRKNGVKGSDYEAEITIDFVEAVRGTSRLLRGLPGAAAVTVRIPAGVEEGAAIRLADEGAPSVGNGPNGDLILRIHVKPHPHFYREGNALHLRLPVTLREAYLGTKVKLPTADGFVQIKIPPRSQTGNVLRVRGKGIMKDGSAVGDLFVHLMVQAPVGDSAELSKLIDQISGYQSGDPRTGLTF